MTLIRTIHQVFDAEAAPAVPISALNARIRGLGSVCTLDVLRREIASGAGGLRTLESADGLLRSVAAACPTTHRPTALDAVVVEVGRPGLRPTAADAVRVLARGLAPGDRCRRARWARLVHALPAEDHAVAGRRSVGGTIDPR